MNVNNINLINKEKCVGCKACSNVCPVNAIEMANTQDGFAFPRLNENKCVNCGKCLTKCVAYDNSEIVYNTMKHAYIVWSKDDKVRINSTSGGVYYELARDTISTCGYICGSAFTEDQCGTHHILGNDNLTLEKTMRSKYFQSDMGEIYKEIKKRLLNNEKVLFVGTPCQVHALRLYLGKEYEKLILCDFVCRGVNSPKAYNKYREFLETKYGSKITSIHFKNKKTGWNSLATTVYFENGKKYHGDKIIDPWINGYIVGHFYMRECCYECGYTKEQRVSDLTFGDLWGYSGVNNDDLFKGISFVTINTPKGESVFNSIKPNVFYKEINIEEIKNGNGCLNGSTLKIPVERKSFFDRCDNERFDALVYDLLNWDKKTINMKKKQSLKFTLKNIVKAPKAFIDARNIKKNMEGSIDERNR